MAKDQKLGQFFKEKRLACNMTQSQVAEELGYSSPQFVSNWERSLSHPPLRALRRLAQLYSLSERERAEVIDFYLSDQRLGLERALYGRVKNDR